MRGKMADQYVERVVDLTEPSSNQLYDLTVGAAREIILNAPASRVCEISGSFALVARCGKTVKMARSLDRPMRYFLAKRQEGPVLIVAHRIDTIYNWLKSENLAAQFHPSYTRMVPAHHVVELQLIGCPDPDPVYTRFFTPQSNALPTDVHANREIVYRRAGGRNFAVAPPRSRRRANRRLFFRWHR